MTRQVQTPLDIIRAGPWDKALFLTYALSLSFFESEVWSALQAGGSPETWVVVDKDGYQSSLMERQSRRVGIQFRLVPVALPRGVFHPKCIYLHSSDRDLLLVGSGNLTFGGFGRNLEVLEILEAEKAPYVFLAFEDFLESLQTREDFLSPESDWLEMFRELSGAAASRHEASSEASNSQLIHSVGSSIASQLVPLAQQVGAVKEMLVLSPYHSPNGLALLELAKAAQNAPAGGRSQPPSPSGSAPKGGQKKAQPPSQNQAKPPAKATPAAPPRIPRATPQPVGGRSFTIPKFAPAGGQPKKTADPKASPTANPVPSATPVPEPGGNPAGKQLHWLDAAWARILEAHETGHVLEATCLEEVQSGLIVDVGGLRAFLPSSHVDVLPVHDLADYVGEELPLVVLEIDNNRRKVVVSRTLALARLSQEKALSELVEGEIVEGQVDGLEPFGAWVDIGGVRGLVPVSELSWKPVEQPHEAVQVGESVEVRVLGIDREKARVWLSLKQALPDLWMTIREHYSVGDIVTGQVTKLAKHYAFVAIQPGVEGVVPLDELRDSSDSKALPVLKMEQEVKVKVLEIEPDARRILLSVRQA